mmetsp:Transcript_21933/g.70873  ORF Transcript_21933/g.70873 Transcript_21933/m.70873 type:complete len:677 (+) Transcript_21933:167-2197(+)
MTRAASFARRVGPRTDLRPGAAGAGRRRSAAASPHVGHAAGHAALSAGHPAASLVELGHDRVAEALKLLELVLKLIRLSELVRVEPLDRLLNLRLDLGLVVSVELAANLVVADGVAHVVGVVLESVLRLHLLLVVLVLRLVLLRLLHHTLNVLLREAALVVRDGDLVLVAGGLVLGRHVQDAVRVNIEAHIDLRDATRCRRDAGELELAEEVVVARARALALEHLDEHAGLVVGVGGEDLLLLRRHGGVARDEHGHDAASRLEAHGERRDVEEEEVLHLLVALAAKDGSLHGGAVRHRLVGVDALAELLAVEVLGEKRLDLGDTRGAANEHDFVHRGLVHLGILERLLHRVHALAEHVHVELLEARAGDGRVEVDALEERVDLDGRLRGGGERALGALARRAQAAERARVAGDVLLVLALELLHKVLDETVVEVLTAQVRVTRGRLHLENPILNGEERHIEGPAPEVENHHVALARSVALLVEAVRNGRSRRLVDDAHHVEAGDDAGILGRLALRVVEVRRNGHHSVLDVLAEERLSRLLHLDEHHRGDFLGAKLLLLVLVAHLDHGLLGRARKHLERPELDVRLHRVVGKLAPDEALRVEHRVHRVHRHLVLGGVTDEALRVRESHIRGRRAVSLLVGDDLNAVVLPHAHARVRGPKVNTNSRSVSSHFVKLFFL